MGEGIIEAGQQGRTGSRNAAPESEENEGKTMCHLGGTYLPFSKQADEAEVTGAVSVMMQGPMKGMIDGEQAGNQQ